MIEEMQDSRIENLTVEHLASQIQWARYPNEDAHTVVGTLLHAPNFPVPHLNTTRAVSVLLPPSYIDEAYAGETADTTRAYPVVYMHDGQNLFDAVRAFNGSEWHVDESMHTLAGEGIEAIVVAIDHGDETRVRDYTPFARANGMGEAYLAFIFDLLKPFIDSQFRTRSDKQHTFMAGSSMGGLISLYALMRYPEQLGGIAAFSPSLWVSRFAILDKVRDAHVPPARVYLDNGSREPSAHAMAQVFLRKGYTEGETLRYTVERGAGHTESAWARRFPDAMRFLLAEAN